MSCPAGRASRTRPTVIAAVVVRFVAYWEMLYSPPDAQPSAALRGRPASALGFFWGLRKGFACGCDGHGPKTEGESPLRTYWKESEAYATARASMASAQEVNPRGRVEWKQTVNRSFERK